MIGALIAVGCGRIGFDVTAATSDALSIDTIGTGPFGAPKPLSALNTSFNEDDPALTADLLELYFDSNRPGLGGNDIYRSVRANLDDPWGNAELVNELSSVNDDLSPGISPDGLTIYLSTMSGGSIDLFVSTRATRAARWSTPALVTELSAADEDTNPQPSADGLALWYCAHPGAATLRQLVVATRDDISAPWSTPTPVSAVNLADDIFTCDPWPSPDGGVLYFVTDRPGGLGLTDIWRVPRLSPTTFGTPEPVPELNTDTAQHDPCLSPDQRLIVYTSRAGGNTDLMFAIR